MKSIKNLKVEAKLVHPFVDVCKDTETYLVLSLEAPNKDWKNKRSQICILPVIDISGSMSFDNKLGYAQTSAIKMVEYLKPTDMAGLVVFANEAEVISPPMFMTDENKAKLIGLIKELRVKGSTNLCGGMLMGFEQLDKLDLGDIKPRLLLLTDGQANLGIATKEKELKILLNSKMGRNTMSCFGYGQDADQTMLLNLSEAASGNFAFIKNPEDAIGSFAKELGGLLSTYAQNIKVEILAEENNEFVEVVSDIPNTLTSKSLTFELSDILSEEVRNLVMKVKLSSKERRRNTEAFKINVKFDRLLPSGVKTSTKSVYAEVSFVGDKMATKTPDENLMKIVGLAELAKVQKEAEEKAKQNDFDAVDKIWDVAEQHFGKLGQLHYQSLSRSMRGRMKGAVRYTANVGSLRNFQKTTSRPVSCSNLIGTDKVYDDLVKDLDVSFTTTAQNEVVETFTGTTPEIKIDTKK